MTGPTQVVRGLAGPWHQPWTALAMFSLLLNLPWELLAMAFYEVPAPFPNATTFPVGCVQAALGDVVITLVSVAAASLASTPGWLFRPTGRAMATYMGVGLGLTVVVEYVNVEVLHRWAYTAGMPTIAGIGSLPLVQWLVLPPIVLWLARRHLSPHLAT